MTLFLMPGLRTYIWQFHNEIVSESFLTSLLNLCLSDVTPAISDVLLDSSSKQYWLLANQTDLITQPL